MGPLSIVGLGGQAAEQVSEVLERAGVPGRVAVVDNARLARRLTEAGREVVGVEEATNLEERGFAAVVAGGLARTDDWQQRMSAWCRAVVPGGVIVLVDRGQATELSRRALCGGLTAVEQRTAGRMLVTSGRWLPYD